MDRLEVPRDFARASVQGDERISMPVVAESQPTEIVRTRAARGNEHEGVLLIDDDARPGVRAAGSGLSRQRMKGPAQLAGRRVERADFAGSHARSTVVGDRRTDDHEIAKDSGRRGDAIFAAPLRSTSQSSRELDFAVLAEIRAALAVAAVEADEASIDRADVQAIALNRRAAIGEIAVVDVPRNGQLGPPDLGAGFRIERRDRAERSRHVEASIDMHRRGLELGRVAVRERFDGIPGVVGPGDSQALDVSGCDALRRSAYICHGKCQAQQQDRSHERDAGRFGLWIATEK